MRVILPKQDFDNLVGLISVGIFNRPYGEIQQYLQQALNNAQNYEVPKEESAE